MERAWEKADPPVLAQAAASAGYAALDVEHTGTKLGGADVDRNGPGRWLGLRGLFDRPLTSYYLILVITTLLFALGMLMMVPISSVQLLAGSAPPHSSLEHQLIGLAVGILCTWLAARCSPRLFRAFGYPLLAVAIVGLGLTLIKGVGVSQDGAARWIAIGGHQIRPSEIAKLALVVWGADLLARKEKLGQLADWRHILVPLLPGTAVLCLLVMTGDDLGTTFILLVIFLALLWVIAIPGRVLGGMLLLLALATMLMMVSAQYPFDRLMLFVHPRSGPVGLDMQAIQGRLAVGAGGWFGVGLSASSQKWGSVPNAKTNFIFAILGQDLGLVGALCVTILYGGLAYTGLRIARRVNDTFIRLAATGATAWIVSQAYVNIGGVLGLLPVTGMSLPLVSYNPSSLVVTLMAIAMLMSFARREPDAVRAIASGPGNARRALSWLWSGSRRQ